MTQWKGTLDGMRKLTKTLLAGALLCIPAMTLTSLTGCKTRVVIVSADQAETFVLKGKTFTPDCDGVFMGEARYQRYRRAVADKILESETKK